MDFSETLDIYLRARFTLIVLVTAEEERLLQTVKSVCERTQRRCLTWDAADGFQSLAGSGAAPSPPATRSPHWNRSTRPTRTYRPCSSSKTFTTPGATPSSSENLRSVGQRLKFTKKSILVTSINNQLPDELKDEAVLVDFPLPTPVDLEDVLNRLTQTPGVKINLTPLGREKLVQAAIGLTTSQAQRVFAKSIVRMASWTTVTSTWSPRRRSRLSANAEALEFYPVTETPDDVGGLGVLKDWLRLRERAFTQEARDYGLPAPKGIALIGIPGTGKSLTAKMIGGLWRLPLLRLDVGALFGSLVGESEERARRALIWPRRWPRAWSGSTRSRKASPTAAWTAAPARAYSAPS